MSRQPAFDHYGLRQLPVELSPPGWNARGIDGNRRGFTLIELLIVTVIISFLGLVLYTTFYQGTAVWKRTQTDRGELRDVFFSEKLAQDLRNMITMGHRPVHGDERSFEFYTLVSGREFGQKGDTEGLFFPSRVKYSFDSAAHQVLREVQSYSQILTGVQGAAQAKVAFEPVQNLQWMYYGRAQTPVIHWQRRWNKECLPNAVKLSVEYADQKQPFVKVLEIPGGGCRSLNPKVT